MEHKTSTHCKPRRGFAFLLSAAMVLSLLPSVLATEDDTLEMTPGESVMFTFHYELELEQVESVELVVPAGLFEGDVLIDNPAVSDAEDAPTLFTDTVMTPAETGDNMDRYLVDVNGAEIAAYLEAAEEDATAITAYDLTVSATVSAAFEPASGLCLTIGGMQVDFDVVAAESDAAQPAETEQPNVAQPVSEPVATGTGTVQALDSGTFSATLTGEGTTVDLSETDSSISLNNYDSSTTEQTLQIKERFDGTDTSTDKIIVVSFANGLGLGSASGMVKNSDGTWSFDADTLPNDLSTIITGGTYELTPGILLSNGKTYQPKSGTLTYTLAPATASTNISIGVLSDWAFAMSSTSTQKTHADALCVETFEGVGVDTENDTPKNSATLKNYILEGYTLIRLTGTSTDYLTTETVSAGKEWDSQFLITSRRSGYEINAATVFFNQEMTFTLRVNKALGVTGIEPLSGSTILPEMCTFAKADDPSSTDYEIITITLTGATDLTNAKLKLYGTVLSTATPGTYDTYGTSRSFSSTTLDGDTNTRSSFFAWVKILVPDTFINCLKLVATTNNSFLTTDVGTAPLKPLGAFLISNPYDEIVSDQMMHVAFQDAKIGVRAVRLPTSLDGAENIVITTASATYTIPSRPCVVDATSTFYKSYGFGYVEINLSEFTSDATEYITDITYEMPGEFQVGASYSLNTFRVPYDLAFVYFGDILDQSAGTTTNPYYATATVGEMVTDSSSNHVISTNTCMSATANMTYSTGNLGISFTPSTSGINGKTLATGESLENVSVTFIKYNFAYPDATPSAVTGYYVYLRAPAGVLSIDRDSIQVTYNSQVYTENDGFFSIEKLDSTDADSNVDGVVYRLKLDQVIMGYYTDSFSTYSAVKVSMDITALPTAPKTAVLLNDMFMITTIDDNFVVSSSGSQTHKTHDFDIDARNNQTTAVCGPSVTESLSIQPDTTFSVWTSARLNSAAWTYYDATNAESTTINLNPDGKAEYGLLVANNSGLDVGEFVALIPIPKYGETANTSSVTLQDNAFGWTASLLEEIDLTDMGYDPDDYSVLYSTTYETDKDSATFVSWSAISDPDDIRMVRIASKDVIPDGSTLTFAFPLDITDDNQADHEGNTNIYSAYIYRDVNGSAGYTVSEPVAIRLHIGIVKGQVYLDANKNGSLDTDEIGINDVLVTAYDASTDTSLAATRTDSTGYYEFLGLNYGQAVYLVFTNPSTTAYRFSDPENGAFDIAADYSTATATGVVANTDGVWEYAKVNCGLIEPYTITFDAMGGTFLSNGASTQVSKVFGGDSVSAPTTLPYLQGHTFADWYLDTACSNVATLPTAVTGDATYYAGWTRNSYTVTYLDHNNATIDPDPLGLPASYVYGDSKTIDNTTEPYSRTGYTFSGWYDAAAGGTQVTTITGTDAKNFTLYARWTANSYTITYMDHENAAITPSGLPTSYVYGVGATINHTTEPYSRTGYTFSGWYDAAAGGTQVTAITGTDAKDFTLYAQWTPNLYTIFYENLYGAAHTNPDTYTYGTGVDSFSDPDARSNYTFAGWYNALTDGTQVTAISDTATDAYTLYARWTAIGSISSSGKATGGNPYDTLVIIGEDDTPLASLDNQDHMKYLNGYPNGTVQAENEITRAEAASIFYRLLNETYKDGTATTSFSDVSSSAWYSLAVGTLTDLGILTGYPDGTFRPNQSITRAEFAAIAAQFDSLTLTSGTAFSDVPESHWAAQYINSAYVKGWVSGYSDYSFQPEHGITRAEMVTVVNKMLSRAIDAEALATVENPYTDMNSSNWFYADIIEASLIHDYIKDDQDTEHWQSWE
ncbi:MAG: InlB B-repeat-containing protein [Oscillospiraceae bacterium]|nr:InlB B-repeat-containing protein [Oscillospiraceae bacterium]